jgi:diguanylate cyclase (GGDEF)-like protein
MLKNACVLWRAMKIVMPGKTANSPLVSAETHRNFLTRLLVFSLTLGSSLCVICFRQPDGDSVFTPLLYLPLILAVVSCDLQFVVLIGLLLSAAAVWIGIHSSFSHPGEAPQAATLTEACLRGVMINAVAVIGGWYAHTMRRRQQEFKQQLQRLQDMAYIDAMTELPNHASFRVNLSKEIRRRAARHHHPLSLILLDVDDFKQVNDRYGHPAGDEVLRQLASVLRANLRDTDHPARYGGDEFVILCPETDTKDVVGVAERIRRAIESRPFASTDSETLSITVSAGVATYPTDADTEEQLISQADAALYRAKESGKNRAFSPIALIQREEGRGKREE